MDVEEEGKLLISVDIANLLWYENIHCVIYTGDKISSEEILKNVEERFNIRLFHEVEIVHLLSRNFVEAKYYPFMTLLMQSLGSIILGLEAIYKHVPDIYIDTMGYAFTLPIFKFLGFCKVCSYVHYPTISTDMINVVQSRSVSINNQRFISQHLLLSRLKLLYYKLFAFVYGVFGSLSEVIMVNSSWTRNHIIEIWAKPERTITVYPPCDVSEFNNIPLERHKDINSFQIVSVAQFRPEKNHQLQIKSFHEFLNKLGPVSRSPCLVLIGSCRNDEDFERVEKLKKMCCDLNLEEHVEFKVNLAFTDIIHEMTNSQVALHTMINEHFGISLVECMAAGLILIAHDSGGPKLDIILDSNEHKTGFLASDVGTYSNTLEKVYKMNYEEALTIRKNAREYVARFSDQKFEESFLNALECLFDTL